MGRVGDYRSREISGAGVDGCGLFERRSSLFICGEGTESRALQSQCALKQHHGYSMFESKAGEDKGVTCPFSNLHIKAKRPGQDVLCV